MEHYAAKNKSQISIGKWELNKTWQKNEFSFNHKVFNFSIIDLYLLSNSVI